MILRLFFQNHRKFTKVDLSKFNKLSRTSVCKNVSRNLKSRSLYSLTVLGCIMFAAALTYISTSDPLDEKSVDNTSYQDHLFLVNMTPDYLNNAHLLIFNKIKHVNMCNINSVLMLLLAGDIESNPGPVHYPCSICMRVVAKNHRALYCDQCNLWSHIKCTSITPLEYKAFQGKEDGFNFTCSRCLISELPVFYEAEVPTHINIDPGVLSDNLEHLKTSKGLKVGHLNVNGLLSKIDFVSILIKDSNLDILALSETKLDGKINDSEINVNGFDLYRLDRDRHGGGVAVYIRNQFSSIKIRNLLNDQFESLWVKVKPNKGKASYVGVVYRSPSTKRPLENVEHLCTYLNNCIKTKIPLGSEIFCLGDFNVNMLDKNALSSKIKELCRSCNLSQLITETTRNTETSSSLIDLILTNSQNIVSQGSIHCGISDHNLIYSVSKTYKSKYTPKTIKFRSFKHFDKVKFVFDLANANWLPMYQASTIDSACEHFTSIVTSVANVHAPYTERRVKGKINEWVNDELRSAIKERDFLIKTAAQTKCSSNWAKSKTARNKVNKLKNKIKGKYYQNTLRDLRQKLRELWKKIKEIIPNSTSNKVDSVTLDDGSVINDNKSIANQFNNFFTYIGSKLGSKFSTCTSDINISPPNGNTFNFQSISLKKVEEVVHSLDNNKATGLDGIGVKFLKEGSPVLCEKLRFLFNFSVEIGCVPKLWKQKRVSPIFKSGDKDTIGNYRPISIASTCMKIFEKVVYKQMIDFITENNILQPNQSGFRSSFSTSSAALDVSEHIIDCLRHHKHACAVLIDLAKAFDTIDHKILLKKLYCYGFRDTSFDWCESYLSDRKQQVLINDTLSDFLTEQPYGVPQGSVLGPLFFLIYINDINTAIKSSYFHLYADDTIIIKSHDDLNTLVKNMESELLNVHDWLVLNGLTPNKKKCESIFFGNPQQLKKCEGAQISFKEEVLQTKSSVKYLGVHFDSTLSWKKQVSEIKRKINFKLIKMRPIAKFLDPIDTFSIIRSLVFPYIHYCSTTWYSAAPYLIKKIQTTCDKTKLFSPLIPTINVQQRLNLDLSIFSFKALNKLGPAYLTDRLTKVSSVHSYGTRQSTSNNVSHSSVANKFATKSIKHTVPLLWNTLPETLKTETSLLRFKTESKKLFLN